MGTDAERRATTRGALTRYHWHSGLPSAKDQPVREAVPTYQYVCTECGHDLEAVQSLLERARRKLILPPGDSIDLTVLGLRGQAAPPATPQTDRAGLGQPQQRQDGP